MSDENTALVAPPAKKIGRPTAYREEIPDELVEFFESYPLPLAPIEDQAKGKGSGRANLVQMYRGLPTFEGFCRQIGVTKQTLWEWRRRYPELREACERASDVQKEHFTVGLTMGGMNPTGAIFAAKNIIGWRDKIDIDQTNTPGADAQAMEKMREALRNAKPDQLARLEKLLTEMGGATE